MLLKQQYFDLIILLNKSNQLKNQRTIAKFIFDGNFQYLYLAVSKKQKILLSLHTKNDGWIPSKVTTMEKLERAISIFLNNNVKKIRYMEVDTELRAFIFKLSD